MSTIATAPFTVIALEQDVADHVREHGRDPRWGHPVVTQPATGFGPCRLCLRTFREGELRKAPYMLVLGDREAEAREVAVRKHREGDRGTEPVGEFVRAVREEITQRT